MAAERRVVISDACEDALETSAVSLVCVNDALGSGPAINGDHWKDALLEVSPKAGVKREKFLHGRSHVPVDLRCVVRQGC